jgi:hypothetical protein
VVLWCDCDERWMADGGRKARRGLWGVRNMELPSEYKKRVKSKDGIEGVGQTVAVQSKGVWGSLKRYFWD